jgi:hypothetical protein
MPDRDIAKLSDVDLVDAAGAASADPSRQLEAEMWRRTTVIAERANLIAVQRGSRIGTVGLWAIEAAVVVILAELISVSGEDSNSTAVLTIVLALVLFANSCALLANANARSVARDRLRDFDATHRKDV